MFKNKPNNRDIRNTVKFLRQFMNLNRKQQLDVIGKVEKRLKEE